MHRQIESLLQLLKTKTNSETPDEDVNRALRIYEMTLPAGWGGADVVELIQKRLEPLDDEDDAIGFISNHIAYYPPRYLIASQTPAGMRKHANPLMISQKTHRRTCRKIPCGNGDISSKNRLPRSYKCISRCVSAISEVIAAKAFIKLIHSQKQQPGAERFDSLAICIQHFLNFPQDPRLIPIPRGRYQHSRRAIAGQPMNHRLRGQILQHIHRLADIFLL